MNQKDVENYIREFIEGSLICPGEISFSYDESSASLWVMISSDDGRLFLTREAEGLHALSHLVRRALEKKFGEDFTTQVVIDINGFQKKKIDNLKTLAHMMAERARFFKSSIDLEPMSAFDRRIVHEYLSTVRDVKTESQGEGQKRHIVITYVNPEI